jgi:hypothetical protein
MLKRQRDGAAMSDPLLLEAGIELFAEACPEQSPEIWDLLRSTLDEGFRAGTSVLVTPSDPSCAGRRTTFRPAKAWLEGRTSPEMLYLETKWASLIPFAKVADLLKDVLPVGNANPQTIRNHLRATAERIEQELGEERQLNLFEGSEEEWEQQPLPDGPSTVSFP